ncbi:hypothetical protein [Flagellimonas onchidii]|uniref:hypothetical protein n=1 Tax=Flagellimonas onchidii TaxID=2562684 RepID=UPI0010A6310D|nr:hypothetical protein [Allomuricauda onchidii]
MKKSNVLLVTIMFLTLLTGCSKDDDFIPVAEEEQTPAVLNQWKLVSGTGSATAHNIGIVLEAKSETPAQETYEKIMERLVGDGDFSLFKTKPFAANKEKFNVYYAIIPKGSDKNTYASYSEENIENFRKKATEYFKANKSTFDAANEPVEINGFVGNMFKSIGLNAEEYQKFFYYADGFSLGDSELNADKKTIIERNIARFNVLFGQKEFDTQVYVSEGVGVNYANLDETTRKIYINYSDDFAFIQSELVHPDYLATTFSHEFGHTFAFFDDEYYDFESDPTKTASIIFNNNSVNLGYKLGSKTFNPTDASTNPWLATAIPVLIGENDNHEGIYTTTPGPIPGYDGTLVKGGPSGYGGYRASNNSIMRSYFKISKANWPNGWNAVQQFYLNYFINKIK